MKSITIIALVLIGLPLAGLLEVAAKKKITNTANNPIKANQQPESIRPFPLVDGVWMKAAKSKEVFRGSHDDYNHQSTTIQDVETERKRPGGISPRMLMFLRTGCLLILMHWLKQPYGSID